MRRWSSMISWHHSSLHSLLLFFSLNKNSHLSTFFSKFIPSLSPFSFSSKQHRQPRNLLSLPMADETHKPAADTAAEAPAIEDVAVVADVPESVKPATTEKELNPEPETAEVAEEKPKAEEEVDEKKEKISKTDSFKEESNVIGDLPDPQKKALDALKALIQGALNNHDFTAPPLSKEEDKVDAPLEPSKTEKETPVVETAPEEPTKPETEADAPPPVPVEEKEQTKEAPLPAPETVEAVVVEDVVEKVTEVDEDGSKTVETIKETIIIEVSAATVTEAEEPAKPAEEAEAPAPNPEAEAPPPPEEVFLWGIPLLGDERSDVILLKFLRARDFKVKEAFTMIKNTVRWRKEFGIEALLEEELGAELEKAVFTHGVDKKGHPVCYNAYGEFRNKELYHSCFGDDEKRKKFLKWRIQFLEKSIRKLDFGPGGVNTIVQVNDLKNSPGLLARELRSATSQALELLQDNYPEFVAKQIFINVPWWYLAFHKVISPFLTQRSKSKFVIAGPSTSAETLFKYIAPEQVPVQYGGLSREGEHEEFTTADPATEVIIKPTSKHTVEFPISENEHLAWEVRVVGWDVTYGAEFVPEAEEGYTVIVQKSRKISASEETVISSSFKTGETGKVVLTIDNQTSKKKKLLYRINTKPCTDSI